MNTKNPAIKAVLIFTLIMGVFSLVIMLSANLKSAKNDTTIAIDPSTLVLVQLQEPQEGDPIAIVDTTLGEFRMVLYPQYSPNAVANFVDLAESGYYNDSYVYNIESGVYASAGSSDNNGSVGDTSHEKTVRELNQNLWPFKGAVCMLNTSVDKTFKEKLFGGGTYMNGSRFALLNTIEFDDDTIKEMRDSSEYQDVTDAFIEKGGIPNFSQQMTVIGQTYEGIEVIEAITAADSENNGHFNVPKEDIKINSVVISQYSPENSEKSG